MEPLKPIKPTPEQVREEKGNKCFREIQRKAEETWYDRHDEFEALYPEVRP